MSTQPSDDDAPAVQTPPQSHLEESLADDHPLYDFEALEQRADQLKREITILEARVHGNGLDGPFEQGADQLAIEIDEKIARQRVRQEGRDDQ
jgi:hypothetical protein